MTFGLERGGLTWALRRPKLFLSNLERVKMAAAQPARSEVIDKPDEEDPREEEQALVFDMLEYRDNLCRHLFNLLSELAAQQVDMVRFGPSFKAGWQEWKKRDEQQE